MHKFKILLILSASCLLLFVTQPAGAVPILDLSGGIGASPDGDTIGGWEFDVTSQITVDALGFWDEGGDGLNHSHDVGLWTIGQTLLAQTTMLNGSFSVASSSGLGVWLFNDIAPLALNPGTYVLGATFLNQDVDFARTQASATTIPEVTFVNARQETFQSTLAFPTQVFAGINDAIFGPNLHVHAVPEPATLLLIGTGLVSLVGLRRKLRS
jgi:hypothetical protein